MGPRPCEFRSCTCVVRVAFLSRGHIRKEVVSVDMRDCIGRAEAGLTQRLLFDNPVDCIRQPNRRRDEIRRVNKPLREAGVRVVDPETPDLGGPWDPGGGTARKDRHTFLVGRRASLFDNSSVLLSIREVERNEPVRAAKDEVRPVFFLNPWGEDRGPAGMPRSFIEGFSTGIDSL